MSPEEKAEYILEKVNNGKISEALWNNCSEYARTDLKRKANVVVDEIITTLDNLGKEMFNRIGVDSYHCRCLNHDLIAYYKSVKTKIEDK